MSVTFNPYTDRLPFAVIEELRGEWEDLCYDREGWGDDPGECEIVPTSVGYLDLYADGTVHGYGRRIYNLKTNEHPGLPAPFKPRVSL